MSTSSIAPSGTKNKTPDPAAVRLLERLHRGAAWRYLWAKLSEDDKPSHWLPTTAPITIPPTWAEADVYFGVHPTAAQRKKYERARIVDVAAGNCLFAEYDDTTLAAVLKMLDERGAPEPSFCVFSGGGIHAYWFLNEPLIVTNDNRDTVRKVQAAWVDFVGGDDSAKDLARVLRVPGTHNHKPERATNGMPPQVRVVLERDNEYTFDELAALVTAHMPAQAQQEKTAAQVSGADTAYGLRALADELAKLRGTQKGSRNKALNKAAFALGQLVEGGELTEYVVLSALEGAAHDLGLADVEATRTIASGMTAGKAEPRKAEPRKQTTTAAQVKTTAQPEPPPEYDDHMPPDPGGAADKPERRTRWAAADLLTAEFSDPVWIVPDLIPAGLTILAGRPKLGKSWLALQTAVAVATGGVVLNRKVERRKVLYVALEDGARRLQDRLRKLHMPSDAALTLHTDAPKLLDGGLIWLTGEIEREHYELVVIDTLARFSPQRRIEDEAATAGQLGLLQRYLLNADIGGVIVDHHRKAGAAGAGDVIDDIMGLTTKSGVLDAAIGIYRQRGQKDATLKAVGRDQADAELIINFDPALFCWQLVGNADEVTASRNQQTILDAIEQAFGGAATQRQIADYTNLHKGTVSRELKELEARGRLHRKPGAAGNEVKFHLVGKK